MESHEPDLREEIPDQSTVLAIQDDYRQVKLDPATRAMLDFAVKLTVSPHDMCREDVDALRAKGFADEDIVDVVQLTGYFNYTNRVLDGLGAEPEPEMRYGRTVPRNGHRAAREALTSGSAQ